MYPITTLKCHDLYCSAAGSYLGFALSGSFAQIDTIAAFSYLRAAAVRHKPVGRDLATFVLRRLDRTASVNLAFLICSTPNATS